LKIKKTNAVSAKLETAKKGGCPEDHLGVIDTKFYKLFLKYEVEKEDTWNIAQKRL
jgi:hypothetical protein